MWWEGLVSRRFRVVFSGYSWCVTVKIIKWDVGPFLIVKKYSKNNVFAHTVNNLN
jgi:hypothetical protein